jgi:hypothetical protein
MAKKGIKQGKKVATVQCARCNRTVNRKQTLATQVFTEKAYNLESELSYRGVASGKRKSPTKRAPAIRVVRVTRMCRTNCTADKEKAS